MAGIQQAHAEQLANMRIQDLNLSLKPLNSVNNPILRKRKLLGSASPLCCVPVRLIGMIQNALTDLCLISASCSTKPSDELFMNDPENEAEDTNVALEKLRDVIAQCILPQAGMYGHTLEVCGVYNPQVILSRRLRQKVHTYTSTYTGFLTLLYITQRNELL